MHVISWGLFLISQIELVIFSALLDGLYNTRANKVLFTSEIVFDITAFTSEVILISIMWKLASTKTERKSESEFPAVEVAEYDAHAELQARIWN